MPLNSNSCFIPTLQDSLEGLEEELSRVGPVLQRYSQLTSKPSVSFAQDSPDLLLPVQAFLSQMECTEDGEVKVIRKSETEWNQLGKATYIYKCHSCKILLFSLLHGCKALKHYMYC